MNTLDQSQETEKKTAERLANTERDDATVGVTHQRKADPKLANPDQPSWQPPESQPEPRPADPISNSPSQPQ